MRRCAIPDRSAKLYPAQWINNTNKKIFKKIFKSYSFIQQDMTGFETDLTGFETVLTGFETDLTGFRNLSGLI